MTAPNEALVTARAVAARACAYLRCALYALVPREAPGLGTLAVSKEGVMLYDPKTVVEWTPRELAGVLVHECLHVALRHHARMGEREPGRWNVACDLAVNPIVGEVTAISLPSGCLVPSTYGLNRGLTPEEYYDLLEQQKSSKKDKNKGEGKGKGKDEGKGEGQGKGAGVCKGACGSCAGEPAEGEVDGDPEGRTEQQMARVASQVAEAIRSEAAQSRGTVPSGLARLVELAHEAPKVPWQSVLRRALRASLAWTAGAVAPRYDAPSRRQAGLGYGPGRPILPRLRQPVPKVAVILDTSGSMGTAELTEAAKECYGVVRAVGGKVRLVACDAEVHAIADVSRVADVIRHAKGGGGTDMRPAFAACEKDRPDVLVVLTDGYIGSGYPETAPKARVIWGIVGSSKARPCPWGEVIHIAQNQ